MFKVVMVSFRTSQELKDSLDRIGREMQCSRSSLIERVLKNFLARKTLKGSDGDLREVNLFSRASPEDPGDGNHIVLGGIRFSIPQNISLKIAFDEATSTFRLELPAEEDQKAGLSHLRLAGS